MEFLGPAGVAPGHTHGRGGGAVRPDEEDVAPPQHMLGLGLDLGAGAFAGAGAE